MTFFERLGGRLAPLGTVTSHALGVATLPNAAPWRCGQVARRFVATAPDAQGRQHQGAYEVRTPSCATRLLVRAPAHVALGRRATIRITDRWGLGDRVVTLCTVGAGRPRACRHVQLAAKGTVTRTLSPYRSGRLRVSVGLDGFRTVRIVAAGSAAPEPPPPLPTLLATGDSTIQGVDGILGDRLRHEADVVSASRPGSGLSVPGTPAWPTVAKRQARRLHPRVTVMSLGANEGYSFGDVECCGADWIGELARRTRALMRTYAGRVLWITQAPPEDTRRQEIVAAVNIAATRAARGLARVQLLDLDAALSPYRVSPAEIEVDGRRAPVLQHDGKHLSVQAATIVAGTAVAQLRARDWLRRPRA